MKKIIDSISFDKEIETKYGKMFRFIAKYEGKSGAFLSKSKEQTKFKPGAENEFTETVFEKGGVKYINISPIKQGGSQYSRAVKKEQSKYSGFAMAYAKDLVVSGNIKPEQMFATAKKMFDWMKQQDEL